MKALYIHTVRRDTVTSGWSNNCWCSKGKKKTTTHESCGCVPIFILVLHPFCEGWIFCVQILAVFLQAHVVIADALAEVVFVQLFLERGGNDTVEQNPTK